MNSSEDIKRAVEAYIETVATPYAIMIDGDWGCGKTHFWKQTLLPLVGEKEALYVSLFGLKSIKDIESEIFKAMSFISEKEGGVIKGLLEKSNIEISDDVKIGGIGFVAQYAMQKWKETRLKKSKTLFICFDDLERWGGDIEECLAYINKLTEHHETKCLIIGNSKKIREKSKSQFEETKDKTIGFTYQLTHDPNDVIDAAFELTQFSSENSKEIITQIYTGNKVRIDELLIEGKCSNIRIVSIAISYLDKIVEKNQSKFRLSTTASVDYFTALLSAIILLQMYLTSDKAKKEILSASIGNSYAILESLGVIKFEEHGRKTKLSEDNRIIEFLYYQCFSGFRGLRKKGIISIVKNGFYRAEDFEGEFCDWRKTEDFEIYLDVYKFHSLEDKEAKKVFENTDKAVFTERVVTSPRTLLFILGRMTRDLKRGVLDRKFEKLKSDFRLLFEELYDTKKMELGHGLDFEQQREKFEYCRDLYKEIKQRNKKYNENKQAFDLSPFWVKLKNDPNLLDDLLNRYELLGRFSEYKNPNDVVQAIESLNNKQLLCFVGRMGSEVDRKRPLLPDDEGFKRRQSVVAIIKQKYGKKFGVRAGHFKQIARILENQQTDYNPEQRQKEGESKQPSLVTRIPTK